MAKDPSKTEQASAKVIQEARRSGNVMKSEELNSIAIVTGGVLLLFLTFPTFYDGFHNIYLLVIQTDCRTSWNVSQISYGMIYGGQVLARILVPNLLAICIIAIVITRAQTGHYLETEPLHWKLDQLNPVNGLKQLLPNAKNTVKLLMVVSKLAVIGLFVYFTIKDQMYEIMSLPLQPLKTAVLWALKLATVLTFKILLFFGVLAIIDYFWQRKKYQDDLMMSKQEVKDERKNAEGDPKIKGRIRQKMRELTMMRMVVEVPKADIVITNPTHVAVALRYEVGAYAPKVVAKGLRKRAQRIKEIAMDAGVPIVEEPPLARHLYRKTKLGAFIPGNLFGAVATILARLHNSGKKRYLRAT